MNYRILVTLIVCCSLLPNMAQADGNRRPASDETIGRIIIPEIHVNAGVVEGSPDDAAVPGRNPVHYASTNLPGEGQTIVISGHHFSHPFHGAEHGVFLRLDELRPGNVLYLTREPRFGGGSFRYVVTSNRFVFCGRTPVGFAKCPPALRLMRNFNQTKVYVITCRGDGYVHEVLTAYQEET